MLQHQIGQSPARLGLSNPASPAIPGSAATPKLSSQVQQSQQQQNNNISTTPITTSTALLSLLPPFARAQTLLLQMATLASRLFEVSSKRPVWLNAFRGSLPTFLSSQTQSVTPPPADSTKEILTLFGSLQTQLFEAVAELQEILDLQDAKRKVSREIRSKDSVMLAFANKLKEAERVLDMLVDDYDDYRQPKRLKSGDEKEEEDSSTTIASKLNLSDILSYAHKISYTTFAPPEFGAGLAPLRGALPPAPQDEQMRASQLYTFADLDVGLPKTVEEKAIESLIELPPPAAPIDPLAGIQGLMPPNLTIPAGWKPGMPVELPTDIPLPPPGWKPGDPITLPPMGPVSVPSRTDEQQPRPVSSHPGLHKAPEPIQVRYVNLDIDQDDDSSDYSSSEASSDED
uniref:Mediator of RNA polymerase II transcription subunit 4 n=1 Tax=Kalanchoe fedtschenkoi TaxID=63787 RepID=A0A7N0R8E9_KALFE